MRKLQQLANEARHSEFPSVWGTSSDPLPTQTQEMLKVLDTKLDTIEDKLNLATAGQVSIAN